MSRLRDIEERLKAATPGPWKPGQDANGRLSVLSAHPLSDRIGHHSSTIIDADEDGVIMSRRDAVFIAHSPDDLAYLLRVARAAERLADALVELRAGTMPSAIGRPITPSTPSPAQAYRDVEMAESALRRALEGDADGG